MKTIYILVSATWVFASCISCQPLHSYLHKSLELCLKRSVPDLSLSILGSRIFQLILDCNGNIWRACLDTQRLTKIQESVKTTFPCGSILFLMTKESYFRYEILVPRLFQVNATFLQFHLPDTISGCYGDKLTVVSKFSVTFHFIDHINHSVKG